MAAMTSKFVVVLLITLLGAVTVMTTPAQSQDRTAQFDRLAARGVELAKADPLAAQLREEQPEGAVRRGFDIGMGAAEGQTFHGPGKDRLRDSLPPDARQGFIAAVEFSLNRNRQKLTDLAPRGAELAEEDPLATELRNQQPSDSARLGFDIGMAAAEGQTAPGPGKDQMRDSLAEDEKPGFTAAVDFSLERNRNASRASTGAAITTADEGIRAARNAETSVLFRLGFDIATAIYGDPDRGAQGATSIGAGALGVRNALSAPGQRGFDAGARFNFSRRKLAGNAASPVETKDDHFGSGGATGSAAEAFQPENSIRVDVRYKKELGYEGDSNAFGYVGPTSCSAFLVSVVSPGIKQTEPVMIGSDSKMKDAGDYYVCTYVVSLVPLNQPITLSVSLSGVNGSAAWKGGSYAQPPPGQQRTIIIVSGRGGGPVELTASQPRATQLFEMVYTSLPR